MKKVLKYLGISALILTILGALSIAILYFYREYRVKSFMAVKNEMVLKEYIMPDTNGKGYADVVEDKIQKLPYPKEILDKNREAAILFRKIVFAENEKDYLENLEKFLFVGECIHSYNLFFLKNRNIESHRKTVQENEEFYLYLKYVSNKVYPKSTREAFEKHNKDRMKITKETYHDYCN